MALNIARHSLLKPILSSANNIYELLLYGQELLFVYVCKAICDTRTRNVSLRQVDLKAKKNTFTFFFALGPFCWNLQICCWSTLKQVKHAYTLNLIKFKCCYQRIFILSKEFCPLSPRSQTPKYFCPNSVLVLVPVPLLSAQCCSQC